MTNNEPLATQTQFIDRTWITEVTHQFADSSDTITATHPEVTHDALPAPVASPNLVPDIQLDLEPGIKIYHGRYELIERLGSGATAQVWKAFDNLMGVLIALKILKGSTSDGNGGTSDNNNIAGQARREVLTALFLQHPNIIGVLHMGMHDHALFIAMKYINGQTLDRIARHRAKQQMSLEEVLDYCSQILEALRFAHGEGYLHGDIKPQNIMIEDLGERQRACVADFGISRTFQELRKREQNKDTVVGTPAFVAPEVIKSITDKINGRADLYSLGVMMFQLLTGRLPFRAENALKTILAHLGETPPDIGQFRPDIPPPARQIIMRCMEKDPDRRYQDAGEMLDAIHAVQHGIAPGGLRPSAAPVPPRTPALLEPPSPTPGMPSPHGSARQLPPGTTPPPAPMPSPVVNLASYVDPSAPTLNAILAAGPEDTPLSTDPSNPGLPLPGPLQSQPAISPVARPSVGDPLRPPPAPRPPPGLRSPPPGPRESQAGRPPADSPDMRSPSPSPRAPLASPRPPPAKVPPNRPAAKGPAPRATRPASPTSPRRAGSGPSSSPENEPTRPATRRRVSTRLPAPEAEGRPRKLRGKVPAVSPRHSSASLEPVSDPGLRARASGAQRSIDEEADSGKRVALVLPDAAKLEFLGKLFAGQAQVDSFPNAEQFKPMLKDNTYDLIVFEYEHAADASTLIKQLRFWPHGRSTPVVIIEDGRTQWYKARDGLSARIPGPIRLDDIIQVINTYL
jgi:serine/threonine-protein kinase